MVSKVAVIALVAIVACPILLGYAMNLNEVTVTEYKSSNDAVNVTPLLQNEMDYTTVQGDIYELNTNFGVTTNLYGYLPFYETYTDTATSFKGTLWETTTSSYYPQGSQYYFTDYDLYFWQFEYNWGQGYLNIHIVTNDNTTYNYSYVRTVYFDYENNKVDISRYYGGNGVSVSDVKYVTYTVSGSWSLTYAYQLYNSVSTTKYIDLSGGFHFTGDSVSKSIKLAESTKSFIMTINLDSITDANYTCDINLDPNFGGSMPLRLVKTTVGADVNWKVYYGYSLTSSKDLYYNSSRNDNTYQLIFSSDYIPYSNTQEKIVAHIDLNYVGGWPTIIGQANSYLTVPIEYINYVPINMVKGIKSITFSNATNNTTPTIRMDASTIDGYEVPVISNEIYTPSDFKSNPSTKISDISMYGTSIVFGGNTYTVDSDGNITMGTHKVPVKNIVLDSVPVSSGYENRINGTVVSTTAQPSTITFNGKWSASIITSSMESSTVTKTEWQAGSFGWDGMDHNFLIVGLLTSFGAFIALGIYIRRTKASLWPLLIVCGGAAVLFFIMI